MQNLLKKQAIEYHNNKVYTAFEKAKQGGIIDLTELMISKEKIINQHHDENI